MVKFSFVIPTFNRKENLNLVLWALYLQTDRDFKVIVSDDGSTDGTEEMVKGYARALGGSLRLKYYWQSNKGYRVSLARNQGMRLADKATTHIWFIDSDVVLIREAVAEARKVCLAHPGAIICGRYDWLPPMDISLEDVSRNMNLIAGGDLFVAGEPHSQVHYVRPDHRQVAWDCETEFSGKGTLSGNLIVPIKWLERGFDENIEGQGQDGEFGYHIQSLGAKTIFCDKMRGYHLHHYIDEEWKTRSVQRTIAYIREKYHLEEE